jgi:hypothetical protein
MILFAWAAVMPMDSKWSGCSDGFGANAWILPSLRINSHRVLQSVKCFLSARLTDALSGFSREIMMMGM